MKIAIIEDEPLAANNLKKLVKNYDSTFTILPIADTVDQAVALLSEVEPDLIFLDIELADGSSFEIFKQIKINVPII
ncbi:MAG: response regulator, partial [Fulvivirga sp.]